MLMLLPLPRICTFSYRTFNFRINSLDSHFNYTTELIHVQTHTSEIFFSNNFIREEKDFRTIYLDSMPCADKSIVNSVPDW